MSIASTLTGMVYFYHYFKAQKEMPIDAKKLKWAGRGFGFFGSFGIALAITSYLYERQHHIEAQMK